MNPTRISFEGGGEATITETDGVFATLLSTRQAAPGTPLRGTLELTAGAVVRLKVKECRRHDESTFVLRGRWIDLPKKVREELVSRCPKPSGPDA